MTNRLQAMRASASTCLLVSLIAFIGGGTLLFAAVDEIYRNSHAPRGWLVIALTVSGAGLFTVGALAWLKACRLVMQSRLSRQTPL